MKKVIFLLSLMGMLIITSCFKKVKEEYALSNITCEWQRQPSAGYFVVYADCKSISGENVWRHIQVLEPRAQAVCLASLNQKKYILMGRLAFNDDNKPDQVRMAYLK